MKREITITPEKIAIICHSVHSCVTRVFDDIDKPWAKKVRITKELSEIL